MKVAIVGPEYRRWSHATAHAARLIIHDIVTEETVTVMVSGGCPLGGVDQWAEKLAKKFGVKTLIFKPATKEWNAGYRPRNIKIAEAADVVYVVTLKSQTLPCKHCRTMHVASGGCWTAKYAESIGKRAVWKVVGG